MKKIKKITKKKYLTIFGAKIQIQMVMEIFFF